MVPSHANCISLGRVFDQVFVSNWLGLDFLFAQDRNFRIYLIDGYHETIMILLEGKVKSEFVVGVLLLRLVLTLLTGLYGGLNSLEEVRDIVFNLLLLVL